MKRLTLTASAVLGAGIAAMVVILAGSPAPAAPSAAPAPAAPSMESHVVRVYYFHTTQRCASCKKIEAFSEVAIREGFGRELAAGTLEWQSINLDEARNRHFIQEYNLYTKSLVVVDVVKGQQARWKNLPKIWELLRDEKVFQQYVQGEVRDYLGKS